ncbi:signal peptidase I [Collinsella sp. zg1085]|uniref:signal peptidase I n=1 Tax=Collinsella sp. zg1085 TaxID=2844380 RepID=UPI001C0BFD30|nr:signal peptidase I [Collinsella sp. zg1085]QWT17048.1 signal peptidase I [Collinsella sp. zg1085]
MSTSQDKTLFKNILEWFIVIAIGLLAALLIREFVVTPFTVPTGSMIPTIQIGDNIFAQKLSLELGQAVTPGDIAVFKNPNMSSDHEILVKRVIAVAGQTIDFQDGKLLIDGKESSEHYTQGLSFPLAQTTPGIAISYPYTVPQGHVWMMGDNREDSADSRYFGPVATENLIGLAVFRYWPLNRAGLL